MSEVLTPLRSEAATANLLDITGVRQAYHSGDTDQVVLDDVALTIKEDEMVALLGRSGSGKSTLLRIAAGLLAPTSGKVLWGGKPVSGPCEGVAMVFQSFALFPWLTVLENVLVGLDALGVPPSEGRRRALEAIDLIGLDGFESAYPKEISGGMRQRVGFARALVVHPKLLLMDEPFSALDVLTAETLRTDILDLWLEGRLPIQSILMVTHNIEEAVLMCDRIMILSSHPGRIVQEIKVDLPQPRNRLDPDFRKMVDQIYVLMTRRTAAEQKKAHEGFHGTGIGMALRRVSTNRIAGLLETLAGAPYSGKADLPDLAATLQMEIDDLFPVVETLQLLRFADTADGDIKLTEKGRKFVDLDVDARKRMFGDHLLAYVPIASLIRRVLDERPSHSAPFSRFKEQLEDFMPEDAAEVTLRTVINWGRYAEVFAYDEETRQFTLENPT
jgi:NitT/TauT family transport system ATP-binding protein